jgi:hypothetical protein
MLYLPSVLCVLIAAAWGSWTAAQENAGPRDDGGGTIRLQSGVSAAEITIGDRFTYELTLLYGEGMQVTPPGAGENLGHFEIKDFQVHPPKKNEDGLTVQRFEFLLSTFTTGEYVIPPVSVAYTDAAGRQGELQSRPLTVTVNSVLPEDAQDIRDIKQAAVIEADYTRLYILIGTIILLAAAAAVLLVWLRRRRRRRGRPAAEEQLPPHLKAFLDLDALCREKLPEAGEFKAFYVRFADIFLQYLTGRFGIRTFERTTSEILGDLSGRPSGTAMAARVGPVLDECDLVKFAKYVPTLSYAENIVERARDFIRETAEEAGPGVPADDGGGGRAGETVAVVRDEPEGGAA